MRARGCFKFSGRRFIAAVGNDRCFGRRTASVLKVRLQGTRFRVNGLVSPLPYRFVSLLLNFASSFP